VSASGGPASYEIRVEGILDGRWAAWFGGLQVQGAGAQTVISGLLAGQPGLHGLLGKIGDLGLCLISVRRLDPDEQRLAEIPLSAVPHHPLAPHPSRLGSTFG
jgi:hypothetical protein